MLSHPTVARPLVPEELGLGTRKITDLSDLATRKRLSPAAIKAFFRIVDLWSLKSTDATGLLGGVSNGKFHELKRTQKGNLSQDELTRISYLVGIFKALNILFSRKLAGEWVQRPNTNPLFGGATPLQLMLTRGMPALMETRRFLDARRGGR